MKDLSRLILSITLFNCFWLSAQFQTLPEKEVVGFFNSLYHYSFVKSDSLRQSINKRYQDCPMKDFINANYYWYLIISGEQTEVNYKHYNDYLDHAIFKLKTIPENKFCDELIFEAILIYAYKARIEIFLGNYFSSLRYLQASVTYLKRSIGREKEFEKFKLTSGLYNYFFRLALDKYPVFYPYYVLLPAAEKEEGLRLLNSCLISDNEVLRVEACYFLMKIFLETEKKTKLAIPYAKSLSILYPENMIFQYHYFQCCRDTRSDRLAELLKGYKRIIDTNSALTIAQKTHFITMMTAQIHH